MEKAIWLSYDLGIGGDYDHLYEWLDNHGAIECGDSVAFLKMKFPKNSSDEDIVEKLKKELEENINIEPKRSRIYFIRREDDRIKGSFIFGSRKGNPWDGYGSRNSSDDIDG